MYSSEICFSLAYFACAGTASTAVPLASLIAFGARQRPTFFSTGFETEKRGKLKRNTELESAGYRLIATYPPSQFLIFLWLGTRGHRFAICFETQKM